MITLSTGVSISIAKTYAAALTVTAASNATECVLTVTNTLTAGDWVEVSSGWGLLDGRVVRIKAATGTSLTLEGVNTSATTKFPAGTGIGSVRKVNTWSQLTQVKGISASGGSLQFANVTAIDDVVTRQMPTVRDATTMTIDCFDDPKLAWYADVSAAADARAPYAVLMAFPNSTYMAGNAYWALQRIPSMNTNEPLVSQVNLSFSAEPIRYAT